MGEHIYWLGVLKKIHFFELPNLTSSSRIRTWVPWILIKIFWSDGKTHILTWHTEGRAYILTWHIIFPNLVIWTPPVGSEPRNPRIGLKYSEVTREHLHLFSVLTKIVSHELRNYTTSGQIRTRDPWIWIKVLGSDGRLCILNWSDKENITKNDFHRLYNLPSLGRIRTRDPWIRIELLKSDGRACILTLRTEKNWYSPTL